MCSVVSPQIETPRSRHYNTSLLRSSGLKSNRTAWPMNDEANTNVRKTKHEKRVHRRQGSGMGARTNESHMCKLTVPAITHYSKEHKRWVNRAVSCDLRLNRDSLDIYYSDNSFSCHRCHSCANTSPEKSINASIVRSHILSCRTRFCLPADRTCTPRESAFLLSRASTFCAG